MFSGTYGQVDGVDLVLHVSQLLQQMEGGVELVQGLHVQLQPVTHIGPVQHRLIKLFLW